MSQILRLKGKVPNSVSAMNYLNLILDSHLHFEKHVKNGRGAKVNLDTLTIIIDCFPFHVANSFMHSMIFPHLRIV